MVSLAIHDLNFSYKSNSVFHNVSLSADGGQILSLVGPNGAGKTTLLKCLNALNKPDSGDIQLNGKIYAKCRGWILRARLPMFRSRNR